MGFTVTDNDIAIGNYGRSLADRLALAADVRDFGAVGDGVTDDTAAFARALAASPYVFIPRASSSYIVGDLDAPADSVFIGASMPIYSAYSSADNTLGHSTLRLKAGATVLVKPAINVTFERIIFEGVDATRNLLGKNSVTNAQIKRLRFIQCGMHRFNRAIWETSYCKEVYCEGCMISANGIGVRDVIDGIFLGNYIHANTGDGVQLNSGANDNQFTANKIEWNGGTGFAALSGSVRNVLSGGIIDASTESNLSCVDADLIASGVLLRRGGRNGTSNNLYINGARKFVGKGLIGKIGKNDDGSGSDSPTTAISVLGSNGTFILQGGDFVDSTTPISVDGGATFTRRHIWGVAGCQNLIEGEALDYNETVGWHYFTETKTIATLATGPYNVTGLPAVSTNSQRPMKLIVSLRQASDASMKLTIFEGGIRREGGGAVWSSATMTGRQVLGTTIHGTLNGGTGTARVSVNNVAADGTSADVTVENTSAADYTVVRVTVAPL